jgi:hypothetical protein
MSANGKKICIKQTDGEIRLVGHFDAGKGLLSMVRKESVHLFRALDAWGLDAEVFVDLYRNRGLRKLRIEDKETGLVYEVLAKEFNSWATFLECKPHRTQLLLPRSKWTKRRKKE